MMIGAVSLLNRTADRVLQSGPSIPAVIEIVRQQTSIYPNYTTLQDRLLYFFRRIAFSATNILQNKNPAVLTTGL
jgi:hypothetical protein